MNPNKNKIMKTENKNMRIIEPGNTTEEREARYARYA